MALALAGWIPPAAAQWIQQELTLNPGWNAVFLDTRPIPERCDEQFAGRPIESVWKWNQVLRTTQFETDPSVPLVGDPRWLVWLPRDNEHGFLNTLFRLEAGGVYLVKVATNAAPFTWTFKGRAVQVPLAWFPYQLNLIGLPVNPANPPSLAGFFKHTAEVDAAPGGAGEIYDVRADGNGTRIRQTERIKITPGRAYWIKAGNPGDYAGPLAVTRGLELAFGRALAEQSLVILNRSVSDTLTVRVRPRASVPPPAGEPELAGEVPLSWRHGDAPANDAYNWSNLTAAGVSRTLPPGAEWPLKVAVRRGDMTPYTVSGTNGAAYQGILEISDSAQQYLVRIPVTAEKADAGVLLAKTYETSTTQEHPCQGLWVGDATLNQVNAPYFTSSNTVATPAPYTLRVILHVDGSGQAHLLQSAVLARAPVGATTNYAYQLFATAAGLPSEASDIYRVSSAAFPVMSPVAVGSVASMTSGTLTGRVIIACNDALNPFLHRYHPMHDNKDGNWAAYTNAVETPDITRFISIQLTPPTNYLSLHAIWGMDVAEGIYREELSGLRRDAVIVQGPLGLRRVSREDTLHGL